MFLHVLNSNLRPILFRSLTPFALSMAEQGEDQTHDSLLAAMELFCPSLALKRPAEEDSKDDQPNKHQRGGKGKGGIKGPRKANANGSREPEYHDLLSKVARLMIAHEDTLQTLLLESEFMVFMQAVGPGSLGEMVLKVSTEYHKDQGSQDAERQPLRMLMSTVIFRELGLRLEKAMAETPEGENIRKELIQQELLTPDGQAWHYMKWNADLRKLVPLKAAPIPMKEACQLVHSIYQMLQTPGLIVRFCALKGLDKVDMTQSASGTSGSTNVIPWKLTVAMRAPRSTELYQALRRLCHCSVMQVVLLRMRPASLQRSPAAQDIAKHVYRKKKAQ